MSLIKYKLGELIEISDLRNRDRDNKYTAEDVKGISVQKEFIETKANLKNVSLNSYRIVDPGDFAYVADTSRRGDKISLAFNDSKTTLVVSTIFKVKRVELLDPYYLFMYFNRPEFDRFSRFNSWGSAREIFSWEDFCDIEIHLPSLEIQGKYVKIYKALLANQEVYEQGLEDLKISGDITIEDMKNKYSIEAIGKYIFRGEKNSDGKYENVLGVGGSGFIPPQKKPNKSLKSYRVMKKNAIAYAPPLYNINADAIQLYMGENPSVCSPIYEVVYTKEEKLVSEYLMLWLKRDQFKRYAAFHAMGVRNTFDYNLMEEFEIPIPPLKTQVSISDMYTIYSERKKINEKLKSRIKNMCPILIKGAMEEASREEV